MIRSPILLPGRVGNKVPHEPEYMLSASGLIVPASYQRRPIAIDLFAGAGGFSCGFHQAGFHVIAALEFDYDAAITYMVNLAQPGVQIHFDTDARRNGFERRLEQLWGLNKSKKAKRQANKIKPAFTAGSGWISQQPEPRLGCQHFWIADARNVSGKDMLQTLGLTSNDITAVSGGPPCQGFSYSGKRDVMDPRNSLVFEFARLVCEIRPHTFVMENVPGMVNMVTPEGIPVLDALCKVFEDGGFGTLDALKKMLVTTSGSGTGAAIRHRPRGPVAEPVDDEADAETREEQLWQQPALL